MILEFNSCISSGSAVQGWGRWPISIVPLDSLAQVMGILNQWLGGELVFASPSLKQHNKIAETQQEIEKHQRSVLTWLIINIIKLLYYCTFFFWRLCLFLITNNKHIEQRCHNGNHQAINVNLRDAGVALSVLSSPPTLTVLAGHKQVYGGPPREVASTACSCHHMISYV